MRKMGGCTKVANGRVSQIRAEEAVWVRFPAPAPLIHFRRIIKG
jgi:hypothetical protein